jgi:hypothetical protein
VMGKKTFATLTAARAVNSISFWLKHLCDGNLLFRCHWITKGGDATTQTSNFYKKVTRSYWSRRHVLLFVVTKIIFNLLLLRRSCLSNDKEKRLSSINIKNKHHWDALMLFSVNIRLTQRINRRPHLSFSNVLAYQLLINNLGLRKTANIQLRFEWSYSCTSLDDRHYLYRPWKKCGSIKESTRKEISQIQWKEERLIGLVTTCVGTAF